MEAAHPPMCLGWHAGARGTTPRGLPRRVRQSMQRLRSGHTWDVQIPSKNSRTYQSPSRCVATPGRWRWRPAVCDAVAPRRRKDIIFERRILRSALTGGRFTYVRAAIDTRRRKLLFELTCSSSASRPNAREA
jgi:hypothetical protein